MNCARYVLGHDVGTSGDKAVLCDLRGRIVRTAHAAYGLEQPRPGWAQQNGDDLIAAVGSATRQLMAGQGVDARDVAAVGISGQMFCTIAVDGGGAPRSPLLSWLDARSTEQVERIARAQSADEQREIYGSVFTAKDIVPKILWLREHLPEASHRAATYVDCKDFITGRLTGRLATDHASASAYLLYDLAAHQWLADHAESLGVPVAQLPQARDARMVLGGLTHEAAEVTGLAPGTPVVIGTGDVPASQLGSGAGRPGQAHLSLGTAGYFGISLDQPLQDPRRRLGLLGHADPGRWVLWAEMETGAGALAWWVRMLGLRHPDDVDRLANSVKPSELADIPLFAPWLTGERVPYWDDSARAAFVGMSMKHGPAELTRAVMEGICFQLRLVFDYATQFGVEPTELRVVGGGTGSLLPAILADVLERTLVLVDDPRSAGAHGAAFCALSACQAASLDELSDSVGVDRLVQPALGFAPYQARFERFRRLHDALAGVANG